MRLEGLRRTAVGGAGWAVAVIAALLLPAAAGVALLAAGLALVLLAPARPDARTQPRSPAPAGPTRRTQARRRAKRVRRSTGPRRWAGRVLGLVAACAGAVHLVAVGANPAAAVALILVGVALAAVDGPSPAALVPATAAAGLVLTAGLDLALGWAGRPPVAPAFAMPHGSVSVLCVVILAALAVRPDRGPYGALARPGAAGVLARHAMPLALVPFLGAAAAGIASRLGSDPGMAGTVAAAVVAIAGCGLLVRAFRALDRADRYRSNRLAAIREQRDFSDTLVRSMAESVLVLDADGRVIEANQRWCELTGRTRDEVIGQAPPYPWQSSDARDESVRRVDGTLVPVLATRAAVPGPDGRPQAYVATYTDITAQKRSGDVMAEQTALLERVNQHLRSTNERLEQAAAFSADLTALLSHEVAQPLTSIASLAELLVQGWEQLPDGTRLEVTGKIDRNARRLVELVRDMLLLFQLDSGTVTARRTPVLVAEAVEAVVAGHPAAEVDTRGVPAGASALVDRGHLELVLAKLIGNAVAYGRPPIEVSGEENAEHVVVAVTDRGEGIAEDLRRRLFDRAVPPSTAAQGSAKGRGLGLFIARQIVEANGGSIRYEPNTPRGARLVVSLPSAAQS